MYPARRTVVSAVSAVAAVGLAITAAPPADATTARAIAADCRAVSQRAVEAGYSERLFAMDDPTLSDDNSPPVWERRDRAFMGVVSRREKGRYRLRVCTVAARELDGETAKTVRQTGSTITLPKGSAPFDAAVANQWITWLEAPRRGRFVIRRQTLGGSKRSSRSYLGRPHSIAMTRNGTVAVSTITGQTQRIWRWPATGPTTPLAAPRTVRLTKSGLARNPLRVQLWDPDSFVLTRPDQVARKRITVRDLDQVKTEPGGRACTVWKSRPRDGETDQTQLAAGTSIVATLTNTNAWSLRGQFSGEDWGYSATSVRRLEACDPTSGNRVLAAPAGYDTETYSVDDDGLDRIAVVGAGIFATGSASSGNTGSGASTEVFDAAYVRNPVGASAWLTSDRHVATRAAAAFLADGHIWTIDATGTRQLMPYPTDLTGLRLREANPVLSVVSTSSTQDFPLTAVAATESVFPQGLTLSPVESALPDGSKTAINFGVCSDQFAKYCEDPQSAPTP